MDFMNRGNRPVPPTNPNEDNSFGAPKAPDFKAPKDKEKKGTGRNLGKWTKWSYIAFLIAIAVLLAAVVASLAFTKEDNSARQTKYVDTGKLQAVFLNGGQVYFGMISEINPNFMKLNNIYYLRVNQQVQPDQQNNPSPNDISLVKLGCELHGPEDSMIINSEQVLFWENLKSDGQVTKAVEEYVKANPEGQNCEEQQSTNTNNGSDTSGNADNSAEEGADTGNTGNTGTNGDAAANNP